MDIYLIRHTEVDVDAGICYGQSDVNIKLESFNHSIEKFLNKLPEKSIIYTSPLKRCLSLAEKLSKEIYQDLRLQEMNFGNWELKAWNDIPQEELNPWMEDFVSIKVPNGESFDDLNQRVSDFLSEIKNLGHENVVVISHAGVIRSILCAVLEIPLKNAFRLHVDYGSVTKLIYNHGHYSIVYCNNFS